jgi:hypothetical protein
MIDETFDKRREALLELLSRDPWFCNVGKTVEGPEIWLTNWNDWPGAEDAGVVALHQGHQQLYEQLKIAYDSDKKANWKRVLDCALKHTSAALRINLEELDAWDPMSTACWQAGWTAAIITEMASIREPIPAYLFTQWRWFMAGHWPAGYTNALYETLIVF